MRIKIRCGGVRVHKGATQRLARYGDVVDVSSAEAAHLINLGAAVALDPFPAAEAAEERREPPAEESPPVDYSKLTKARLLELCAAHGINASAKLTKAELCVLLVEGHL